MRVVDTELPGVLVIEVDVVRDPRGFFLETYHFTKFHALGIPGSFVQDNYSRSSRGTLRGLHLQVGRPQAKLVRVVAGEIFDVAVDVRRGSPTFGRWVGASLKAESFRQLYVPEGFAHGFAVLSTTADVEYKCTDVYDPGSELCVRWNDPVLAIDWPIADPLLSDRDRSAPTLAQVGDRLPVYEPVAAS
jgi:dTDP-4-dehydrorhamnose 3,5-epimerase